MKYAYQYPSFLARQRPVLRVVIDNGRATRPSTTGFVVVLCAIACAVGYVVGSLL
jgi:hypothetical protein